MEYRDNGIASENLTNLSVCVRNGVDITPIKCKNDLNGNLVLINNIIPWNDTTKNYTITKGSYVRYLDIAIIPKYYF